jgi:hypothetical protein
VLGHTPSGVLRELKNTAERGLFTAFPHPLEHRFTKALARIFPGKLFRVYDNEASLRRALIEAGYRVQAFPDPALPQSDADALSLWRPFLEGAELLQHSHSRLLIPVLPWSLSPKVLVIPESLEPVQRFPPSDLLSPVILASGTRSIYDLIAAAPKRGNMHFPKIQEALFQSKWHRRGIYLYYSEPLDKEPYVKLFHHFLESGFLLPPNQNIPLILPGILSPGEEGKLAELLKAVG